MASIQIISAAVIVFIVAAALWYQSQTPVEHFASPPVAGRWYNPKADQMWPVPADLNKATVTAPQMTATVPPAGQRPAGVPGAPTSPRDAMATRRDLSELNDKIRTWLAAATLRESEYPGSLTPKQLQRRAILQARLVNVDQQLNSDLITDTHAVVAQEITSLRTENAGWGKAAPNLDAVLSFAKGTPDDTFLDTELYAQFKGFFQAVLNEYKQHSQPSPLEHARLQQLEVIGQDLQTAERAAHPHPPSIRAGSARLFLEQSLKPDQPLPTLLSLAPNPATTPRPLAARPDDVIRQLRDIEWKLTVKYDPAGQALKRRVADLLQTLQAHPAPAAALVEAARSATVELQNAAAVAPTTAAPISRTQLAAPPATQPLRLASDHYEPGDLIGHANTLCDQLREAFPAKDAIALGCPATYIEDRAEAESIINIVCDRIRYSVPTVSPAQFGCPVGRV
jgi:hypothetical protein